MIITSKEENDWLDNFKLTDFDFILTKLNNDTARFKISIYSHFLIKSLFPLMIYLIFDSSPFIMLLNLMCVPYSTLLIHLIFLKLIQLTSQMLSLHSHFALQMLLCTAYLHYLSTSFVTVLLSLIFDPLQDLSYYPQQ